MRILVVENNEFSINWMNGVLANIPLCCVDFVRNGEEAYKMYQGSRRGKKRYDLVLTELIMPILDGF